MSYVRRSVIINILLVVVAVAVSYSASRMVRDAFVLRKQSEEMTQKIDELIKEKRGLEAYLAEMQTKEAVEREAKDRLNLKKPGEEVVVIVPEKKEIAVVAESQSWWAALKHFFER
ncbi:MAG: septum formation initiator family protein [bacterium]|nr:septum formation initiator family protein [bacterium]